MAQKKKPPQGNIERRNFLKSGVLAGAAAIAGPDGSAAGLVATARMTRYHRPGCSLAAGKEVSAATRAEQSAAGRRPCGVCTP